MTGCSGSWAYETDDHLLSIDELARYLAVLPKKLYAWRTHGEGPPGFRVGKHVRYRWSDVQAWIQQQIEAGNSPRRVV